MFWAMLIPAVLDGVFTLIGQDAKYWSNYKLVNEASPAWFILSVHPLLFVLLSVVWFVMWYLIYKKLKSPINLMMTIGFIAGHSYGAISWINRMIKLSGINPYNGWYIDIVYFVFLGLVCGKLINYFYKR